MRLRCLPRGLAGLLLAAVLAAVPAAAQQEPALSPGVLVEDVAARADTAQRYALYVPRGYDPDRAWPLLLAFDPLGRGSVPVRLFREAADEYGFVVAGSNVSRNGPIDVSLEAAVAMEADVAARLNVDPRRVYATGFSGGARVASLYAVRRPGGLAGVVACGAGLHPDLPLERLKDVAYYSLLGVDDFNFPELYALEQAMLAQGHAAHFDRFDGAHRWPPPDAAARALAWLRLHEMRTGRAPVDTALVGAWHRTAWAAARRDEADGRALDAYRTLAALARDLEGLGETAAAAARVLEAERAVERAKRSERDEAARQLVLMAQVQTLGRQYLDPTYRELARDSLAALADGLRREARARRDSPARRLARRAVGQAFAYFIEAATLSPGLDEATTLAYLELAALVLPQRPGVHRALADHYERRGDARRARRARDEAARHERLREKRAGSDWLYQ